MRTKGELQEHKENVKNTRSVLKVLQKGAVNKENLVGRVVGEKAHKQEKRKTVEEKGVQAGGTPVTVEDLTSEEPSAEYWKKLAEKRQEMLNESFHENEKLVEAIECLQEENRICKEMLDESRNLVEVLQEMLGDVNEDDAEEEAED